ncbi:hypothetical protein RCO48_03360 [Peribacillus frigoritolerans]|nr:hypothetical protein [Peribacillus frigoritolerans]
MAFAAINGDVKLAGPFFKGACHLDVTIGVQYTNCCTKHDGQPVQLQTIH